MTGRIGRRGLAWMVCVLAALELGAQGMPGTESVRTWAKNVLDQTRGKAERGTPPTVQSALGLLGHGTEKTRAALALLSMRPAPEWAEEALKRSMYDPQVVQTLFLKGYRRSGQDPLGYLGDGATLRRPWTCGLGMHLDPQGSWRFQWIPNPVLMGRVDAPDALPAPLRQAPVPSALLHLRQLRPGMERLKALAGGEGGLGATLIHGRRAGFLLRHVDAWLKNPAPGLSALADREAWILHYGLGEDQAQAGTLVFLPGALPTRTELVMGLLRLNPLASGPRSRTQTWPGPDGQGVEVAQIKGAGGILHVLSRPEGTWICDREGPLRTLLAPAAQPTLGERTEWARVALAGRAPGTEVSLWTVPPGGATAAYEVLVHRRRQQNAQQGVWPNPFIAKAAPRTQTFSLALGAGPTELMLRSFLRVDDPYQVEDPRMPEFAEGGKVLTPAQQKAYQAAVAAAKARRTQQAGLKQNLKALQALLDLRGAALCGGGFVQAPPLTEAQKATLATYRRLQATDREAAWRMKTDGRLDFYGPSGEPGMTPALALAIPIQEGREGAVQALLQQLWPQLFKGSQQKKMVGTVEVRRVRTNQAFAPCHAIVAKHLVLGSDEGPVAAMIAGLQGQAPTLADWQSPAYGRMELDGPRAAADLEALLVSFLGSRRHGMYRWLDARPTADDASAEVASTFGPFLGAVKALGRTSLEAQWTPGGLEIRPR